MLNIDYFNTKSKIDNLFMSETENKYIKKIDLKSDKSEIITYSKKDNIEELYRIYIYTKNNYDVIETTIPIKNSNYKYRTEFYDIESVYYYLQIHKEKS